MGQFLDPPPNKGKFLDPVEEKKTAPSLLNQAISGPGVDIARGFLQGSQDVVRPAASVAEFLRVPDSANIFKQAEENAAFLESGIPESTTQQPAKFINELIGRAPGLTAEFAQGGAILRGAKVPQFLSKGVSSLEKLGPKATQTGQVISQSSKGAKSLASTSELAFTSALEELRNGFPEALEAAKGATTIGFAFGAASPVVTKGFELMKQGLTGAAKKLIQVSTNNLRLAEDFIKNPFKYNLRFFDKSVKTVKEAKQVNNQKLQVVRDKNSVEIEAVRKANSVKREELAIKQKEASNALKTQSTTNRELLADRSSARVNEVRENTTRTLQNQREVLGEQVNTNIGHTLDVANKLREQNGTVVSEAIQGIVAINPKAGVPLTHVIPGVKETLQEGAKRGLIKLEGLTAKPITSGQKALSARINRWVSDLTKVSQKEKIVQKGNPLLGIPDKKIVEKADVPLEVLQGLKNDARAIAQRAYKAGDNATGKLFSDLSKKIDPAKLAENPNLPAHVKQALSPLAEANKNFSNIIQPYNDLVKLVTTTDANGQLVVNSNALVSAVRNNNRQVIHRILKIDSKLPEADRLMPKIRAHNTAVDKALVEQKAAIKETQRAIALEKRKLNESQKKLSQNLSKDNLKERGALTREQRESLRNEQARRQEELGRLEKELDDEILFLEDQDALRAFQGKGLTGLLQRIFAFGEVLPFFTGGGKAAGIAGLAPILGFSPNIVGKAFQTGVKTTPVIEAGARSAAGLIRQTRVSPLVQRFLASEQGEG